MKALIGILFLFVLGSTAVSQTTKYDAYLRLTTQVGAISAAGKYDESTELARSLLKDSLSYRTDWNYGNAVHVGHLALGRAALASGDLQEAEKQLILSVDAKTLPYGMTMAPAVYGSATPRPIWKASPSMDSFGPDMLLAKELLLQGRKDAVIKYLDLCSAFWSENSRLVEWRASIMEGSVPNFGANLVYFFPGIKSVSK